MSRLQNHLLLNKLTDATDKKHAVLAYMGAVAFRKLFDRVQPEKEPDSLSYDEIVATMKNILEPSVNQWSARISFRKMKQHEGESLFEFEARLRTATSDCGWAAAETQLSLIEQFIAGLGNQSAQQALLMKCKDKTKFSDVFNCASEVILAQEATASMNSSQKFRETDVHAMKSRFKSSKPQHTAKSSSKTAKCFRCGKPDHLAPKCPLISAICNACGTTGHIAGVCRKKMLKQNFLEEFEIHSLNSSTDRAPINIDVLLNGKPFKMELDTGCALSTMSYDRYVEAFPNTQLHENDIRLRTATGEMIEPLAYTTVQVGFKNR